jgi:mannose-1-phosphate guanylyltransferase
VNGDVLTDLDVSGLVAAHIQRRADATIALTRVSDPSAFGVVSTGDEGRVLAFVEKPTPAEAPSDLINAGTYVFEPGVVERIPDGVAASAERELFPGMVPSGQLFAFPSPAYWIDAGTFPAYLQAQMDLIDDRRHQPPAPGARRRDDGVWTLGTPSVHGEVAAPSLVGDAAFVASGAVVERSVVGAGARVQDGARLRNSVLLPGSVVRSNAVVEDSVVGERAVVGEEAKLTGLCVIGGGLEVEPGAHLDSCRLAG